MHIYDAVIFPRGIQDDPGASIPSVVDFFDDLATDARILQHAPHKCRILPRHTTHYTALAAAGTSILFLPYERSGG